MRHKIHPSIQKEVRQRANFLCEYCHASEIWQYVAFTIEHVIPISLGGSDHINNLALCCFACNRNKSNLIEGLDPRTNKVVQLFNPRIHKWHEHFIWSRNKLTIMGLTAIGRATVNALELNRSRVTAIRKADLEIGRHPPDGDPFL